MLLDMLFAHRAEGARLRDRHPLPLPGDVRALARGRAALRHEGRGVRGAERRGARRDARRELWESKPDLYLAIAKVEPLVRALGDLDAWITGIRRDQSPTRANAPKLGWDAAHELWKANPLADWSDDDCWAYIRERGLPYNALHDRGYESIGDTHSTAPGRRPRRPLGRHRPHRVRPARRGACSMSSVDVPPRRCRTSTSSRPRRSTSCARSPPSASGRAALLGRQGLDRDAAARREGVPAGASSRSRSCTSTRATTSPR